jgi:hypothetical protein
LSAPPITLRGVPMATGGATNTLSGPHPTETRTCNLSICRAPEALQFSSSRPDCSGLHPCLQNPSVSGSPHGALGTNRAAVSQRFEHHQAGSRGCLPLLAGRRPAGETGVPHRSDLLAGTPTIRSKCATTWRKASALNSCSIRCGMSLIDFSCRARGWIFRSRKSATWGGPFAPKQLGCGLPWHIETF